MQVTQAQLITTPNSIDTVRGYHKIICAVVKVFRQSIRLIHAAVVDLPEGVHRVIKGTKFLSAIDVMLDIPELINELHAASIAQEHGERMSKGLRSLFITSTLIKNGVDITDALKDFNVLQADALPWTETLVAALYPLSVVRTACNVQAFYATSYEYKELKMRIKLHTEAGCLVSSCKAVIELKEIAKKRLELGSGSELEDRAKAIIAKLEQGTADGLVQGVRFIKGIRRRISACYSLDLTYLITRISVCVTMGLKIWGKPHPVLLAVATITSLTALSVLGTRYVLGYKPFIGEKGAYNTASFISI